MERLSISATPPSHFRFKIESFSSLSSFSTERFESCVFDAGDYKWKLAFYPNGNKERGVEGQLSLYLVMVDESFVNNLNKEILVSFSLSVFNHIEDKLSLLVQGVSRFSATKCEAGFDKFLSLKIFKDPLNGYLVDDTCMFGAEVFFVESTPKPASLKYTWKIEKFSKIQGESCKSETFTTGGHDWNMLLYPNGDGIGNERSLSLFLELADPEKLSPGVEVPVEFSFRIIDKVNKGHSERKTTFWLSKSRTNWGWHDFFPLSDLNSSTGYLLMDTCILEAEVIVCGSPKLQN